MIAPSTSLAQAPESLRLLAIAGSLRRDSLNRRLLEAAAELAPAGIEVDVYTDLASIPFFDEDMEAATHGGPAPVKALRSRIRRADGVLIATPEYNHSIPGVLKNTLDWLSRGGSDAVLRGKPVAVAGVSTGAWGTRLAQSALRQVLFSSEALVLPSPALFLRGAAHLFDASGALVDESSCAAVRALLVSFGDWIRRVAPAAGKDMDYAAARAIAV